MRPYLLIATANGILATLALLAGLLRPIEGIQFYAAHGAWMVAGVVWPLLADAHLSALRNFTPATLNEKLIMRGAFAHAGGAAALGFASLVDARPDPAMVGYAALLAAAVMQAIVVFRAKGESLVTEDPLTKGDDACMKHLVFAHRFLPLGILLLLLATFFSGQPAYRMTMAGSHVLVVGYALLSVYGIGHLWVPRFSGVPAIAAGAIKGELHTTLLGLTGLTIGFLTDVRGIMMGLGFFVFVGMFTYMGVLGANIMRNKSPTNSVRPEFVYIPFTFTAVFWLISGVLMGLFLNAVPDVFAEHTASLRMIHLHIGLAGGMLQLLLGFATRSVAMAEGRPPPHFSGAMKFSFFALNGGFAWALYARFVDNNVHIAAALAIIVLGVLAWGRATFKPVARMQAG